MQAGNIKPVNASETRRSAFDGSGKDQQPQTRTLAPQPPIVSAPNEPSLTSINRYVIAIYPDGRHLVSNMALGEAPRGFTEFERVLFKTLVDLDSYFDKLEEQCKSNTSST